jgi:hypothetical protein
MRKPSTKVGRVAAVLASPIAVVLAGALIWQSSYASFSSTTRNSGNNWATGTVALTDDDAGSARFQVENMVPGQTDTRCIKVTANTSVPGSVRGYLVNPVPSAQGLEDHILISVNSGTGGGFGSCTGFVADSAAVVSVPLSTFFSVNSFEAASATGAPWLVTGGVAGGESKTYQITWTFDTTGMTQSQQDALQGARTGADVQWELRNN